MEASAQWPLKVDVGLLQRFEDALDVGRPEKSTIPARVLGFGEISTVLAIEAEGLRGFAFKRMPLFAHADEVSRYTSAYQEYCRLLEQEIGLSPIPQLRGGHRPDREPRILHHPTATACRMHWQSASPPRGKEGESASFSAACLRN